MRVTEDVLRELITNKTTVTSEKSPSTFPEPSIYQNTELWCFLA